MSPRPGEIIDDYKVDLPYPRNRWNEEFGSFFEKIMNFMNQISGGEGLRKEDLVDESKNSIDAIAEKYLNICSCMSPNDNRFNLLSRLIDEYRVDGVIDVILQACHIYNVETHLIKKFTKEQKNIPYMSIETDYSQNDIGQLKTSISAFLEML